MVIVKTEYAQSVTGVRNETRVIGRLAEVKCPSNLEGE